MSPLSFASLANGALDGATNFFAGWANTFTFGGYDALMRYTGGSYFINTGSTAYSSGSLIGGIHQSLLTGNAMTSYSCATWIGKIARLGEFYNATNDFAEAIVAGARIYYDPEHSSGWDYLTVIMGVSGFTNLRNMTGCFVVDTPVATGWGEYQADVMPTVPAPDDDWSLTWLSLGVGCIALVVTIKQRRRQHDEDHSVDVPQSERIAAVPDENYRLDQLFARWNGGDHLESLAFQIDPPGATFSTEEGDAISVDHNESYNAPERNDPMIPLNLESTLPRKLPRSLRDAGKCSWLSGWATAFLLLMAGLCLYQASPGGAPATANVAQAGTSSLTSNGSFVASSSRSLVTKPIQQIEPGDRVIVSLPEAARPSPASSDAYLDQWLKYADDETLPEGIEFKVRNGLIVDVVDSQSVDVPLSDILGTRYVVGDVDATDITPTLWRAVDLQMTKPDGSVAELRGIKGDILLLQK